MGKRIRALVFAGFFLAGAELYHRARTGISEGYRESNSRSVDDERWRELYEIRRRNELNGVAPLPLKKFGLEEPSNPSLEKFQDKMRGGLWGDLLEKSVSPEEEIDRKMRENYLRYAPLEGESYQC